MRFDEKLQKIKTIYESLHKNHQNHMIKIRQNVNNYKRVLREKEHRRFILKESQHRFPHLTEQFISQHFDLFANIHRNILIGKHIIKEHRITNPETQKAILRRWALAGYAEYYLTISESLDDFVEKADRNLLKVFSTQTKTPSILTERTKSLTTSQDNDQIVDVQSNEDQNQQDKPKNETTFRIQYTPSLKIDPEDKDPDSIHSLVYWDRIAQEEPDAPDIKEYKNRRWLHAMGVDGDLLEDPMFKGDETLFHPKILQKLRNRSKFEQKMIAKGLSGEDLEQALAQFDKENKLEKVIQMIKNKQEGREIEAARAEKAGFGADPPENKKEEKERVGFFRNLVNKVGATIKKGWENAKSVVMYPVEVTRTMYKKVVTWVEQAKQWLEKHPYVKKSISVLLLIGFGCVIGHLAAAGGIVGLLATLVQVALSAIGVFKSSKNLIDLFKEMSGGKLGWEGVKNVINNFQQKKYLIQFLIAIVTFGLSLFSFISSLKSLSSQLHKLAAEYGVKVGASTYNPQGASNVTVKNAQNTIQNIQQGAHGPGHSMPPDMRDIVGPTNVGPTNIGSTTSDAIAQGTQQAAASLQSFSAERTRTALNSVLKYLSSNSEAFRQDPQAAQQIADYALKRLSDSLVQQYGPDILTSSVNNPVFQGVFGRGSNVTVGDALKYMIQSASKVRLS